MEACAITGSCLGSVVPCRGISELAALWRSGPAPVGRARLLRGRAGGDRRCDGFPCGRDECSSGDPLGSLVSLQDDSYEASTDESQLSRLPDGQAASRFSSRMTDSMAATSPLSSGSEAAARLRSTVSMLFDPSNVTATS